MSDNDKTRAVRLRNVWQGRYMTCNDHDYGGYYWLLSQDLHYNGSGQPNWETQVWIKEDAGNGHYRLRSDWVTSGNHSPLYVSQNNTFNNPGYSVFVQPLHVDGSGNPDWNTQSWVIE